MSALSKVKMSVSCPWDRRAEAADLMGVVLMSKRELNRIDILARLESGRLTPGTAAALLQVSERQVYRLRRRFRDGGPAGIADRRRGRPSNNRLPDALRQHAVALVHEHHADFGPTLAAEKAAIGASS
jgi:hypothetical protein